MGTCHIFVNTTAFHKCFCQVLTDNTSSRLFMAPPLPQWPRARRTGQPRRVKAPTRTHPGAHGAPLGRLQLSLEGTLSIRRPAGWLLPSKPASANGPVKRAPRTQPSVPRWAGRRGTPRSPGASPGRGGTGPWREEGMMGHPLYTPPPPPPPPPRAHFLAPGAPRPRLWEELSGHISEVTWARRTALSGARMAVSHGSCPGSRSDGDLIGNCSPTPPVSKVHFFFL